jgi:hypothetical protein
MFNTQPHILCTMLEILHTNRSIAVVEFTKLIHQLLLGLAYSITLEAALEW